MKSLKSNQSKNKNLKRWNKPVFATISAKELKAHIKAAARSTGCGGGVGR